MTKIIKLFLQLVTIIFLLIGGNVALAEDIELRDGVIYISAELAPKKGLRLEGVKYCRISYSEETANDYWQVGKDSKHNKIVETSSKCHGDFAQCYVELGFYEGKLPDSIYLYLITAPGGSCERQEISDYLPYLKVNRYEYLLVIDQSFRDLLAQSTKHESDNNNNLDFSRTKSSTNNGISSSNSFPGETYLTLRYNRQVDHDEILYQGTKLMIQYH